MADIHIEQFSGVRQDLDAEAIPVNAAASSWNVRPLHGALYAMPGLRLHSRIPEGITGEIRALAEYHSPVYDPATMLVAVIGNNVYATRSSDQSWSSYVQLNTTVDPAGTPRLLQVGRHMYLVDGHNPAKRFFDLGYLPWDMWAFGEMGSTDDVKWGSASYGTAEVDVRPDGSKVFVADRAHHRVLVLDVGDHAVTYAVKIGKADGSSGAGDGELNTPRDIASTDQFVYICDYGNARIAYCQHDGTWLGSFGSDADPLKALHRPTAITIGPNNHFYIADSSATELPHIKEFNAEGVFVRRWGGVAASAPTAYAFYFGSVASSGICTDTDGNVYYCSPALGRIFKFTSTGQFLVAWAMHGDGDTDLKNPYAIEWDDGYLYVTDLSHHRVVKWTDTGIYQLAWGAEGDTAPTPLGTFLSTTGLAIDRTTHALYIGDAWNWRVQCHVPEDQDMTTVEELVDVPAPSLPPGVTEPAPGGSAPYVATGDYLFRYAYEKALGPEYFEGPASPITAYEVTAGTLEYLTITVYIDPGASLRLGDRIKVYLQTPTLDEYRCIETINFTGDSSYAVNIYPQTETDDVDTWELIPAHYHNRPPVGCTDMIAHRGRMVYVLGDLLYFSDWNVPESVPVDPLLDTDQNDGGYITVGQDGADIVALGSQGSMLIAAKRRGIWLCQEVAFGFTALNINTEYGCSNRDSMTQLGGAALIWLDGQRLIGWDGAQFTPADTEIRPLLESYSLTALDAAYGVFDPYRHWFALVIPTGVSELTAAQALIFDVDHRYWMPMNFFPPGPLLVMSHAATQGVYAADNFTDPLRAEVRPAILRPWVGRKKETADSAAEQEYTSTWLSKAFRVGDPPQYHTPFTVSATTMDTDAAHTLGMAIYANAGLVAPVASANAPIRPKPGNVGMASWRPPRLADLRRSQVELTWTTEGDELTDPDTPILALDLLLMEMGGIR